MGTKSEQLQIRVTRAQKAALHRRARQAGLDLSSYVLARALPAAAARFGDLVDILAGGAETRFALAELNDLLSGLGRSELADAVAAVPPEFAGLPPLLANYVAAMVEQALHREGLPVPAWVREVPPLTTPHFATPLRGLRLYLLGAAPVPFRRRNLFVDAAVGARV